MTSLSVYQQGQVVRDRFGENSLFGAELVQLPDEQAGTVMLFKIYDRISYGLVMTAFNEIRVNDIVRNPE